MREIPTRSWTITGTHRKEREIDRTTITWGIHLLKVENGDDTYFTVYIVVVDPRLEEPSVSRFRRKYEEQEALDEIHWVIDVIKADWDNVVVKELI